MTFAIAAPDSLRLWTIVAFGCSIALAIETLALVGVAGLRRRRWGALVAVPGALACIACALLGQYAWAAYLFYGHYFDGLPRWPLTFQQGYFTGVAQAETLYTRLGSLAIGGTSVLLVVGIFSIVVMLRRPLQPMRSASGSVTTAG